MIPNDYTMRVLQRRTAKELQATAARERAARAYEASLTRASAATTASRRPRAVGSLAAVRWLNDALALATRRLMCRFRPALALCPH